MNDRLTPQEIAEFGDPNENDVDPGGRIVDFDPDEDFDDGGEAGDDGEPD